MLGKLSFRNAKRQAKDYVIYFITVIISVALMFSFNSIAVSNDISDLSSYMKNFGAAITAISILIVFIMAWLINYCMRFMLEKRSKEFGTYQILGIEKKSISNMFTLENLMIGGIAFVIGLGVGTFLYQIFTSIIMNLFNVAYKIEIAFSLKAAYMTAIYFFGIFILVLLNCRRKIKKTKVYDLLYADKKNENNIIKNSKGNIIIFVISIVLLVVALFINHQEFTDASNMSVTIGTIAVMFTIIIIGGNVALLFNNMLNNEIEMGYPFEIMVSTEDGDFSKYKEYIEKNTKVKDMYEYRIYNIKGTGLSKAFNGTTFKGRTEEGLECVLSLNDYNRLREILGYEKVELQDDEILINCLKTAKGTFEKYIKENNKIKIAQTDLKIKEIRGENLSQVGFNGYYYTIIVPDKFIPIIEKEDEKLRNSSNENEEQIAPIYYFHFGYNLVVTTESITDEKFYQELRELIDKENKTMTAEIDGKEKQYNMERLLGNVQTKGQRMSETKSFYAIVSFLAFYVALIFVMATATLLAIQQLSDSEKYKYRYELLKKLGMDELEMNRTIFKQLFFYFAIPMLVPIIVSIPAILSIGSIFTVAVTMEEIFRNIAIILGMFILVYGIYFIATDVQFDRNINGNE